MDCIVKKCVKEIQNNAQCDSPNIKLAYQDALPYFNIKLSFQRKAENNKTTIRLFPYDNSEKIKFGYQYLNYPDYGTIEPLKKYMFSQRTATQEQLIDSLENFLNCVLIAPGLKISGWLRSVCYLGPLREIPPRDFTVDKLNHSFLNRWRWERGLAAWDEIYFVDQQSIRQSKKRFNAINDWLASDQRLNTGYEVRIEHYREIFSNFFTDSSEDKSQEKMIELIKKIKSQPEKSRVFLHDKSRGLNLAPSEIGVGISQVLPVVVAAVGANAQLVAIEQPELHIHPALQVQLGDLFIEQSKDREKLFLIETHSEHLLLRILRRIRERKISPVDVGVVFVEPLSYGGRFIKLRIDEEGDFIDEWPGGFFEESFHEKFAGR